MRRPASPSGVRARAGADTARDTGIPTCAGNQRPPKDRSCHTKPSPLCSRKAGWRCYPSVQRHFQHEQRARLRANLRLLLRDVRRRWHQASAKIARFKARSWLRLYALRYLSLVRHRRYGLTSPRGLCPYCSSAVAVSGFQRFRNGSNSHFATEAQLGLLRSLFLTLGGALIGATVYRIFARAFRDAGQHRADARIRLLRRLSADRRLLSAFLHGVRFF